MEQVLEVYKRAYDADYPVICMDETPKQLIGETKMPIKMKHGQAEKYDYEYTRNGVTNIFMASEPLAGKRMVSVTATKTKVDWAQFMKSISDKYRKAKKITVVMDNYGTHKIGSFYEIYSPEEAKKLVDRFEIIYTPKHGSWLNMAEIELNVLQSQCLSRRIDNIETVKKESAAWVKNKNSKKCSVNWQFSTIDARVKLKRLYPTIED